MNYYQAKISRQKQTGNTIKKVTETYLINCDELDEAQMALELHLLNVPEYRLESITTVSLYDVYLDGMSDRYYKCKVGFITLDEKAGTEKRKYAQILVQANNIDDALQSLNSSLEKGMTDYEISSIAETPYMDFIQRDQSL